MRTSEIRLASSATSQPSMNEPTVGGADPVWKDLYKVGGAAALIIVSIVMLRSKIFSKTTAYLGIVARLREGQIQGAAVLVMPHPSA